MSVLISIRPEWCEKIVNGKKTIEVRKSAPKEVPFKAYIYCTKEKPCIQKIRFGDIAISHTQISKNLYNGKVIGEFVCDKVEMVNAKCSDYGIDLFYHDCLTNGCLTEREIEKYFNIPEDKDLRVMKGNGYVWHISDLKIYDKPKELSEFYTIAESGSDCCCGCVWHETPLLEMPCRTCTGERKYLYRPPQSWQYIEEVKE